MAKFVIGRDEIEVAVTGFLRSGLTMDMSINLAMVDVFTRHGVAFSRTSSLGLSPPRLEEPYTYSSNPFTGALEILQGRDAA